MVLQSLLQMLRAILRGGDWFVSVPVYLDTNSLRSLSSRSLTPTLTRARARTHTRAKHLDQANCAEQGCNCTTTSL